jgi:isopentenyl diphosphate isomerase/L-lactate dehydrogenase-like FMN-dependent dehydrogenase
MRPGDALKALECGVDGIVVSNHGGKVLDGSAATLDALPAIAEAVGGRCEILLDGGLRRGADLVRARALGANAALIGRPWLWGLAAGGEHGVAQILDLFRRSLSATLANLDLSRFDEVDGSVLRLNGGAAMHEAG